MSCIQRCSSSCVWLPVSLKQSFHSPLTFDIIEAFSTQRACTHWIIFNFFGPFSVNPRDRCVGKFSIGQYFLEYSDQPFWHQQPCIIQSQSLFFPILTLGLNFQWVDLTISTCLNALSSYHAIGCLDVCFTEQVNRFPQWSGRWVYKLIVCVLHRIHHSGTARGESLQKTSAAYKLRIFAQVLIHLFCNSSNLIEEILYIIIQILQLSWMQYKSIIIRTFLQAVCIGLHALLISYLTASLGVGICEIAR